MEERDTGWVATAGRGSWCPGLNSTLEGWRYAFEVESTEHTSELATVDIM